MSPASQHSAAFKTMPHNSLHSMQSLTAGSRASIMCSTSAACPASITTAKGPSAGQESGGTGHAHGPSVVSVTMAPNQQAASQPQTATPPCRWAGILPACHPALEYTHDCNSKPDARTNMLGTPRSQQVAATNPCRHACRHTTTNAATACMRAAAGHGWLSHAVPCSKSRCQHGRTCPLSSLTGVATH